MKTEQQIMLAMRGSVTGLLKTIVHRHLISRCKNKNINTTIIMIQQTIHPCITVTSIAIKISTPCLILDLLPLLNRTISKVLGKVVITCTKQHFVRVLYLSIGRLHRTILGARCLLGAVTLSIATNYFNINRNG